MHRANGAGAISILSLSMIGVRAGLAQAPNGGPSNREHRSRILGVYDQDSGTPLEGVRVADLLSGTFALTTRTGTVALSFLPDGGGLVRLQKLGYEQRTMFVAITPADTTPLTIVLARVAELPAVVTKADSFNYRSSTLRGFEERRRAGTGGYFIGEEALRSQENSSVANVARRFPGFKSVSAPGATWLLPTTRCNDGTHAGPPQVYLDGVPWSPPIRPDAIHLGRRDADNTTFNLDDFHVEDLAGMEFYPDNTSLPVGLTHNAQRCGALFLWLRER
jgi:hypothetical protein